MTTTTHPQLAVYVRWIIPSDLPEVLRIESSVFEFPWCENEFIRATRQRNCTAIVAQCGDKVLGYSVYELHPNRLHVINFAVHEDWRFKGVGRAMVDKLKSKLSSDRRRRIMLEVRESNLDAQLFWRAVGFRCVGTMRDFYEETNEAAYLLQYRFKG